MTRLLTDIPKELCRDCWCIPYNPKSSTCHMCLRRKYYKIGFEAGQAKLKAEGWVKLAKDQSLPDAPPNIAGFYDEQPYSQAQKDILKAGFKRVE